MLRAIKRKWCRLTIERKVIVSGMALVGVLLILFTYIYVDVKWFSVAKIAFLNKTDEHVESLQIIGEYGTSGEKVNWEGGALPPGSRIEWRQRLVNPVSTLQTVKFKNGKVLTQRERYMGNGREILLEVYGDELRVRVVREGFL